MKGFAAPCLEPLKIEEQQKPRPSLSKRTAPKKEKITDHEAAINSVGGKDLIFVDVSSYCGDPVYPSEIGLVRLHGDQIVATFHCFLIPATKPIQNDENTMKQFTNSCKVFGIPMPWEEEITQCLPKFKYNQDLIEFGVKIVQFCEGSSQEIVNMEEVQVITEFQRSEYVFVAKGIQFQRKVLKMSQPIGQRSAIVVLDFQELYCKHTGNIEKLTFPNMISGRSFVNCQFHQMVESPQQHYQCALDNAFYLASYWIALKINDPKQVKQIEKLSEHQIQLKSINDTTDLIFISISDYCRDPLYPNEIGLVRLHNNQIVATLHLFIIPTNLNSEIDVKITEQCKERKQITGIPMPWEVEIINCIPQLKYDQNLLELGLIVMQFCQGDSKEIANIVGVQVLAEFKRNKFVFVTKGSQLQRKIWKVIQPDNQNVKMFEFCEVYNTLSKKKQNLTYPNWHAKREFTYCSFHNKKSGFQCALDESMYFAKYWISLMEKEKL